MAISGDNSAWHPISASDYFDNQGFFLKDLVVLAFISLAHRRRETSIYQVINGGETERLTKDQHMGSYARTKNTSGDLSWHIPKGVLNAGRSCNPSLLHVPTTRFDDGAGAWRFAPESACSN